MRLSTSTNILDRLPDGRRVGILESLRICSQAGFKVFDMNFCDNGLPDGFLAADDWEWRVDEIAEEGARLGIEFSQSHLEFYNVLDPAVRDRQLREEMVRRGIIASGKLSAKWAVFHPGTVYVDGAYSREKSLEGNIEYVKPHLETAAACGVGLAAENLPDKEKRRFAGAPEELIGFVDALDSPGLGICWDFGHGNLMKIDQAAWLKKIGFRLKAVHVADNCGQWDEHRAPFYGNIDWRRMVEVLKEIGFQYDFTYEIHNMTKDLPFELREKQLAHLVDIGNYLLGM